MNDTTTGRDGWWLASDGRWYPPALHPDPSRRPGWWRAADGHWYPPAPAGPPQAGPPSSRPRRPVRGWAVGAGVLLVGLLLGALAGEEEESRLTSGSGATTTTAEPRIAPAPAETTAAPASTTTMPTVTTAVEATTTTAAAVGDVTTVGSITDGDTLRTAGSLRVRLIGIDSPERGGCYYSEAGAHLARLVPIGTAIRLEYDVERLDRYGRTLAYVFRADDGLFVNLAMARDGFAQQLTVPPNVAHADGFGAAVDEARAAGRGLWGGCQGEEAAAPTATTTTTVTTAPTPTTARPARTTTTPASACHSSYEGTCIPPDVSDADCAGGSGNGPWYVQERNVRVVGPDVFDLDRDGDGLGCES